MPVFSMTEMEDWLNMSSNLQHHRNWKITFDIISYKNSFTCLME